MDWNECGGVDKIESVRDTTLTALGRFQEKTDANINTLVDECQILCTQVESLGDNMCRWAQEETFAL